MEEEAILLMNSVRNVFFRLTYRGDMLLCTKSQGRGIAMRVKVTDLQPCLVELLPVPPLFHVKYSISQIILKLLRKILKKLSIIFYYKAIFAT